MDDYNNPIIYGLESQVNRCISLTSVVHEYICDTITQARALTPQLAEPNEIRFFIATQSLKPNNQLHLIELNADASSLATRTKIFAHPLGEVWKLNSSPYNSRQLVSCYSTQKGSQVVMQSAILTLPPDALETDATNKEYMSFESVEILDTEVCIPCAFVVC